MVEGGLELRAVPTLAASMVGQGLVQINAVEMSVGVLIDAAPKSRMMASYGHLDAALSVLWQVSTYGNWLTCRCLA
jgi:hypothetical protein